MNNKVAHRARFLEVGKEDQYQVGSLEGPDLSDELPAGGAVHGRI